MENATELKIIEAAKEVFQKKGYDGARMQEIADEAKINKAMLHYYFRTKERLFDAVLQQAIATIFPKIMSIAQEEISIEDKIRKFVHTYIDIIIANPALPNFIFNEMTQRPDKFRKYISHHISSNSKMFMEQYKREAAKGNLIEIEPEQFFISLVGSCIFPFIGKPLIKIIMKFDDKEFQNFIEARKEALSVLMINAVKKKK
jgi:TetR/AcrR family transcriptional regulator